MLAKDSTDQHQLEETQELMKKLAEGNLSLRDVFSTLDSDRSGKVSSYEFQIFTRRIGMNLTHHRINEIFANVKKV